MKDCDIDEFYENKYVLFFEKVVSEFTLDYYDNEVEILIKKPKLTLQLNKEIIFYYRFLCIYLKKCKLYDTKIKIKSKLSTILDKYPDYEEFAHLFAECLLEIIRKNDEKENKLKYVNKLEKLSIKYQSDKCILISYATSIYELLRAHTITKDDIPLFEKIEDIYNMYSFDRTIAILYSKTLFYLILCIEELGIEEKKYEILDKLRRLEEKFRKDSDIAVEYFRGIEDVSIETDDLAEKQKLIVELKKILKIYIENEEIVRIYLNRIRDYVLEQPIFVEALNEINELEFIMDIYKNNDNIVCCYLNCLYGLVDKQQSIAQRKEIVERFKVLESEYKADVASYYSESLYKLLCAQTKDKDRKETLKKLEELSNKYTSDMLVAGDYAMGLVKMYFTVDEKEKDIIFKKICDIEIFENYSWDSYQILPFAEGLYNILLQKKEGEKEIVEKLRRIANVHEYYENVVDVWAKAVAYVNTGKKE